ncbi:MAG: STAS domain-containing protein [Thermodesulfobacteriota bacterium]
MLSISARQEENMTVLDFEGDFDLNAHGSIEKALGCGCDHTSENLVWNFKGLRSINGSGIAILVNAVRKIRRNGWVVKLTDVGPEVLDVFQVHKVLPAFDIHTDEAAAKKQLRLEVEKEGQRGSETSRRLFERVEVGLKARFKQFRKGRQAEVFKTSDGMVTSLSRCGVFLSSEAVHPRGAVLDVQLQLPNGLIKPVIKFLGKVAWVADNESWGDKYPGMALRIVCMEDKDRAKLSGFLDGKGV